MCYTIHSVDELIQILEQLLKQDKKMFPYNNARIIIGEDVVNDLMYYLNDYNRLI